MQLNDGGVISAFMGQALRGEDLTVFGDGSQSRSFCYIDDQVEGIYRLLFVTLMKLQLRSLQKRLLHLPVPVEG